MDTGDTTTERDPAPVSERPTTAPEGERRSRSGVLPRTRGLLSSWWPPGLRAPRRLLPSRGARRAALFGLVVCVLTLSLVNALVAQPFVVPSGSMENTLRVGDRIMVNKLAYRFGDEVRRGDLIVFDGSGSFVHGGGAGDSDPLTGLFHKAAGLVGFARPGETDYTKRVIGIGGDRVTCCDADGRISINGMVLDERAYLYPGDRGSTVPFDVVVPDGTLFVLGDHRSASSDSRDHLGQPGGGMVPVDKVIGRADWIVWPPSHFGEVERPRVFARVPDGTHG